MIKKQDFIEIEYTARLKDEGIIFDTTDEKTAKEAHLDKENAVYGPVTICVGEGHVLKGLDEALVGKETAKNYSIELSPEDAFGKKSAKLVQLISTSKFKKQGVEPMPGLQVGIDGVMGIIKTVSGGRTLVDFNHPLAGKDIIYEIKINKAVTDPKERLESLAKLQLNANDAVAEIKEGKASLSLSADIPEEIRDEMEKKVKELIPEISDLTFKKKVPKKEEEPSKEKEHLEEPKKEKSEEPKKEGSRSE